MVSHDEYLKEIDVRIKTIEKAAAELLELGKANSIPAVYKNARRITASVNILKLEVSDLLDLKI
jgi:hypothetical protein